MPVPCRFDWGGQVFAVLVLLAALTVQAADEEASRLLFRSGFEKDTEQVAAKAGKPVMDGLTGKDLTTGQDWAEIATQIAGIKDCSITYYGDGHISIPRACQRRHSSAGTAESCGRLPTPCGRRARPRVFTTTTSRSGADGREP